MNMEKDEAPAKEKEPEAIEIKGEKVDDKYFS